MGNDRGIGSATPASPVILAKEKTERFEDALVVDAPAVDAPDEDAGAIADIELEFRRKIAALRRMPPRDRPHALRAARERRLLALHALKEKRAYARYARFMLRRLQKPAP